MRKSGIYSLGSTFALLLLHAFPVQALDADEIVYNTTQEVVQRLQSDQGRLETDPNHIKQIVRQLIVPHMDFDTMSALALGQYWDKLESNDQACVSSGFRNLLVERYAYVLLAYRDQDISYQSAIPTGHKDYISITQTLTRPNVKPLTITYPMRPVADSWQVIDLVIDDVSLVKSYRRIFGKKIDHQGIYGFIHGFPECNQ